MAMSIKARLLLSPSFLPIVYQYDPPMSFGKYQQREPLFFATLYPLLDPLCMMYLTWVHTLHLLVDCLLQVL